MAYTLKEFAELILPDEDQSDEPDIYDELSDIVEQYPIGFCKGKICTNVD